MARIPVPGDRAIPQYRGGVVRIDTGDVGAGLRAAGGVTKRIVEREVARDDEAAVNEFRRKLNDWENANVYDPQNGAVAKRGKDALELPKIIPAEFDKFVEAESSGAYSPRARQAIAGITMSRREQLTDWSNRYAGQQRELYLDEEYQAGNQSSIQRSAALATNKALVDAELLTLRARAASHYRSKLGQSADPNVIAGAVSQDEQKFHSGVMASLLTMNGGDYAKASTYFNEYAGVMATDDMIRYNEALTTMGRKREILAGVQEIMDTTDPAVIQESAPTATLHSVVEQIESAGQRWDPKTGGLLTSLKGAQGEMQVMSDTAKDPGYGVRPAQDDSPDELARVGRDYIDALVREYKGDTRRALAAYNAGPGSVGKAVLRAREEGGDWLSYLPQETQDYVAKANKLMDGVTKRSDKMMTLNDYEPMLRSRFQDPEQYAAARQELENRITIRNQSIKLQREEAQEEALLLIDGGSSVDALPPDLYSRLDPNVIPSLRSFARSRASGEDIATDWGYYYDLVTDPKRLTDEKLKANQHRLGEQEFKELTRMQSDLLNQPQKWRNVMSRKEVVQQMMAETGLNVSTKRGKERVGEFMWALSQRITDDTPEQQFVAEAAKLLREEKVKGVVFGTNTRRQYELTPEEEQRIIVPREWRGTIADALRAEGLPVTEQAVREIYLERLRQ